MRRGGKIFVIFGIFLILGLSFVSAGWFNDFLGRITGNAAILGCTDTCSSLGYQCGTQSICGVRITCGSCSNAHGTTSCSAGFCFPVCSIGYLNCDNNVVNGCETQLGTTTNCGFCGNVCLSGQTCNSGACVSSCTNDCSTSGTKQCSGNGYQTCGNYDSDSCLEWSSATSCSTGQTCSGGVCSTTCTNDCSTSGTKQCSGNGYQTCGNYDSDSCLEWSSATSCSTGQTCSGGVCSTTCTNDCSTSGTKQCSGNGYQTCGNYDSDSCLEWSSATSCSTGQTCSGGVCSTTCTNDCSTSGAKQCSGNGYQTCGNYDSDSCLEWSSATSCSTGQTCSGGVCSTTVVCGNGVCNPTTENCENCVADCACLSGYKCSSGTCVLSVVCGDGVCGLTENCGTCVTDCGCPNGQTCSSGICVSSQTGGTWSNELMINGGFEWGNLTGWTTSGEYWTAGTHPWATYSDSGGMFPQSGSFCAFYRESPSSASYYIYQDVNLGSYASSIDAGTAYINLSGWGVSAEYDCDDTRIIIYFLNSAKQIISTPVDTAYNETKSWWRVGLSNYPIPAGTRYVRMWGNTYESCCDSGSLDSFSVKVKTSGTCTPTNCSALGRNCGIASDGCGGNLSCGTCPTGQTCSSGTCVSTCTNDCTTSGLKQCSGNGYQTCGNYDSDSCLEWSSATSCSTGQTCSDGNCVLSSSTWQTGLVAWWKLDGNLLDSSKGHSTTNNGATFQTTGCAYGQCARFDGINDYIQVAYASDLNMDSDLTMAAWVYWDGAYSEQNVLTKEGSYEFRVAARYVNYATNPWAWRGDTSTSITSNAWYHVVVTHDGDGQQVIYINGVPKYSTTSGGNIITNSQPLTIGGRLSAAAYFDGAIDEVMIWNRALNPTEVQSLFNSFQLTPVCTPSCTGRVCGDNGCGGSCGTCPTGQTCSSGTCTSSCTNDLGCISIGLSQCTSTGLRTCDEYDGDGCLEWNTPVSCNDNNACTVDSCPGLDHCLHDQSINSCINNDGCCPTGVGCTAANDNDCAGTCTNDCSTSGAKQCSGNGYQTCGNYDSDSCLEWSSATSCSTGQTCLSGICVSSQAGTWSNELMINSGFEWGNLTGWTTSGTGWAVGTRPYATYSDSGGMNPQSGSFCAFYKESPSSASYYIYQDVNLVSYASFIDAGKMYINVSGWGVSAEYDCDNTRIIISFLNSAKQVISIPVDTNYVLSGTWWKAGIYSYLVPSATRYVRVWGNSYESCCDSGSLDSFSVKVCSPSCTGRVCGDNGCGGSCGTCPTGQTCMTGACKVPSSIPVGENKKNMGLYSTKEVFLISEENWRNVLQAIPLTTWTGNEYCIKGYMTPSNVCVYPTLIYHEEGGGFDADSIIYFMQQYGSQKATLFGDSPVELDKLLVEAGEGAGISSSNIKRINPADYIHYWASYKDVVYVQDNYEMALIASTYASLINAPLIIKGTSLDIDENFVGRNILCVFGDRDTPPRGCNERYNINQIQKKYVEKTGTDKVILVNPDDLNINTNVEGFSDPGASCDNIHFCYNPECSLVDYIDSCDNEECVTSCEKNEISDDCNSWCTNKCKSSCALAPEKSDSILVNAGGYSYFKDLTLYELYGKTSLAAPILASAKHELIISSKQPIPYDPRNRPSTLSSSGYELDSSPLEVLVSRIRDIGMNANYLTIVAAPNVINDKIYSWTIPIEDLDIYIATDQYFYPTDDNLYVGRIMGMTLSDVSGYLARDLFYDSLSYTNYVLFMASSFAAGSDSAGDIDYNIRDAESWIQRFTNAGYPVESEILRDSNDFNPEIWDKHNYQMISYGDHAAPSWLGISNNRIPELGKAFVVADGCQAASTYDSKSFWAWSIRKGAIGYVGAVSYTDWMTIPVFEDFVEGVYLGDTIDGKFYKSLTFGQAIGESYKDNVFGADYLREKNRYMVTLIGDPTININPSYGFGG